MPAFAAPANSFNYKAKVSIGFKQSSYYDHTFYRVPFKGKYNGEKIAHILRERFFRGQFISLGGVTLDPFFPNCFIVEHIYHIGD